MPHDAFVLQSDGWADTVQDLRGDEELWLLKRTKSYEAQLHAVNGSDNVIKSWLNSAQQASALKNLLRGIVKHADGPSIELGNNAAVKEDKTTSATSQA